MRNSYSVVFIAVITACPLVGVLSGLHASAEAEDAKSRDRYPTWTNVDVSPDLVPMVDEIYIRSSTFKAQCARIGEAKCLRVSIQLDTTMRSSCRAFTVIARKGRMIRAEVHLPPSGTMFGELIGHEFEHILEQLEGLHLRELVQIRGSGVREVERDLFETDRAERTGRVVADEVRSARAAHRFAD
jgi:hypothetical protein